MRSPDRQVEIIALPYAIDVDGAAEVQRFLGVRSTLTPVSGDPRSGKEEKDGVTRYFADGAPNFMGKKGDEDRFKSQSSAGRRSLRVLVTGKSRNTPTRSPSSIVHPRK